MGVCYVVGAGECSKLFLKPNDTDFVIAADGGLRYLEESGIKADVIVGDFDSLGVTPKGINVIKLNKEKDITDMDAAVSIGIEKGFTHFKLFGVLGGRFDHSLANIQLAASLSQKKFKVELFGDKTYITAITNGSISFDSNNKGYISVFSHSDISRGVSIKGLKYELTNSELKNAFPLGVSNEFTGKSSEITVENGTLIIIKSSSLS